MKKRFVSRGGDKLDYALEHWKISVGGFVCADFGSSTGGFVDCLLQRGAAKVYAIDTAYGALDWKLRQDSRVIILERTNALHVQLPELVDIVTCDAGWTRQKLIVSAAMRALRAGGILISLLKPHYEAASAERTRGKVRPEFLDRIVQRTVDELTRVGFKPEKIIESPLVGAKGANNEFLLLLRKGPSACP